MLTHVKSRLAFHYDALRNSFTLMWQRKFSAIATIFVIGLILTLPALFWILTQNALALTKDWKHSGQISVYLAPQIENPNEVFKKVNQVPGVEKASLKTPAEGMKELESQEGMGNVMMYLADNPLPYVIEVTPKPFQNPTVELKKLTQDLQAVPGVAEAKMDIAWISKLYAWLDFTSLIIKGFIILLTMAVIFTIGNTLQLIIDHRASHIQVLKLVGASDSYILRPFLYSGMWFGFIGSVVAIIVVQFILFGIGHAIRTLSQLYQVSFHLHGFTFLECLVFILFAVFLGWLSANISVKRQLMFIGPSK